MAKQKLVAALAAAASLANAGDIGFLALSDTSDLEGQQPPLRLLREDNKTIWMKHMLSRFPKQETLIEQEGPKIWAVAERIQEEQTAVFDENRYKKIADDVKGLRSWLNEDFMEKCVALEGAHVRNLSNCSDAVDEWHAVISSIEDLLNGVKLTENHGLIGQPKESVQKGLGLDLTDQSEIADAMVPALSKEIEASADRKFPKQKEIINKKFAENLLDIKQLIGLQAIYYDDNRTKQIKALFKTVEGHYNYWYKVPSMWYYNRCEWKKVHGAYISEKKCDEAKTFWAEKIKAVKGSVYNASERRQALGDLQEARDLGQQVKTEFHKVALWRAQQDISFSHDVEQDIISAFEGLEKSVPEIEHFCTKASPPIGPYIPELCERLPSFHEQLDEFANGRALREDIDVKIDDFLRSAIITADMNRKDLDEVAKELQKLEKQISKAKRERKVSADFDKRLDRFSAKKQELQKAIPLRIEYFPDEANF